MRRSSFFAQFATLPFFTSAFLKAQAVAQHIAPRTLEAFIYKGIQNRQIITLKRGVHVTTDFWEKHRQQTGYQFYLSNALLEPSYISLESALQYYGIIPEAIRGFTTAVTTKLPRTFEGRHGVFRYKSITPSLFHGFTEVTDEFTYLIALPHKAIFDYLYYKTKGFAGNITPQIFEEYRIDVDALSSLEKERLALLLTASIPSFQMP